eukprot:scaffold107847_cov32-Tisochrysis_lutea.AAC.4
MPNEGYKGCDGRLETSERTGCLLGVATSAEGSPPSTPLLVGAVPHSQASRTHLIHVEHAATGLPELLDDSQD